MNLNSKEMMQETQIFDEELLCQFVDKPLYVVGTSFGDYHIIYIEEQH